MTKESTLDVDFNQPTMISSECGAKYRVVDKSVRHETMQELKRKHSESITNSVIGPLRDWKVTSYANFAKTHERMFKVAFDLNAPERNDNLIARSPSKDELEVIESVREVSVEYFEQEYGTSLTVHRGISHSIPHLLMEYSSGSGETPAPINTTALSNFTTIPGVAKEYGVLMISLDVPVECIAVASDQLFLFEQNGGLYCPEAEVRVIGEALPDLPQSNLVFPSTMEPVMQKLKNPYDMTMIEHSTMEDVVTLFAEANESITGGQLESTLWNWFDAYRKKAEFEAKDRVLTIEKLINSSIRSEPTG